MEKHNFCVTTLILCVFICVCRAAGIQKPYRNENVKTKYDDELKNTLTFDIQHGSQEQKSLSGNHIAQKNKNKNLLLKDEIQKNIFKSKSNRESKRQSAVHFYGYKSEKDSDSWQKNSFHKSNKKLREVKNDSTFIEKFWNHVFRLIRNVGNQNSYERPSEQSGNQYLLRVKKSVGASENITESDDFSSRETGSTLPTKPVVENTTQPASQTSTLTIIQTVKTHNVTRETSTTAPLAETVSSKTDSTSVTSVSPTHTTSSGVSSFSTVSNKTAVNLNTTSPALSSTSSLTSSTTASTIASTTASTTSSTTPSTTASTTSSLTSSTTSTPTSQNFHYLDNTTVQITFIPTKTSTSIHVQDEKRATQRQTTMTQKPKATTSLGLLKTLTSSTIKQVQTSSQTLLLPTAEVTKGLENKNETFILSLSSASSNQSEKQPSTAEVERDSTVKGFNTSPEPPTDSETSLNHLIQRTVPAESEVAIGITTPSTVAAAESSAPEYQVTSPEPSSSSSNLPESSTSSIDIPKPSSSSRSIPEPSTSRNIPEPSTLSTSISQSTSSPEPSPGAEFESTENRFNRTISSTSSNQVTPTQNISTTFSAIHVPAQTSPVTSETVSISSVKTPSLPKSKPEPVPTPEPGHNIIPESDNSYGTMSSGVAEPGPNWKLAKKKWAFAWPAHLYLFGSIFVFIAVFVLISMIQLWRINRLLSRRYFFTLNLLIFYFCVLRAFYLLFDGYNANGTLPDVLQYLLYSSVFPCLTSAFSILLFSLLTATQMQLVPPKIQKLKYLIIIILIHFIIQIISDITVGLSAGARIMLFVCQLLYILWGFLLFCGYLYVFRRLYCSAVKRQKTFQYLSAGKSYLDESHSENKKFTLSLAVRVTLVAAVFGLTTVILEIYAITSVYGIMSDKQPGAWAWWIYHTALRCTECLMCFTMSYIASQPFRYQQKYKHGACYVLCAPCLEMLTCHRADVSDSLGWENDKQLHLQLSASEVNGHVSDKKKVSMKEEANIVHVAGQPGNLSRPSSLLIIEDGYVRFQTDNDINRIVDSYTGGPKQEMLSFSAEDGIVNDAYLTMDDPNPTDKSSSHGYTRKGSLASSEYFRPPSSLSLADSMDMEIDKAFRSLHEPESPRGRDCVSSRNKLSRNVVQMSDQVRGRDIEAYLEEQASQPLPMLRRSRSALGDISDEKRESWRQRLFRSRSDNSSSVKTKDLDNQKYYSLLDLEQQRQEQEKVEYSSDDIFLGNSSCGLPQDYSAVRNLLTNSSESDEIAV